MPMLVISGSGVGVGVGDGVGSAGSMDGVTSGVPALSPFFVLSVLPPLTPAAMRMMTDAITATSSIQPKMSWKRALACALALAAVPCRTLEVVEGVRVVCFTRRVPQWGQRL